MDTEDIGQSLTKKAGPLPLWAWGVGLGAIVVAVMWMRARSNDVPAVYEPSEDAALDNIDGSLAEGTYNGDNANDQYSNGGIGGGGGIGASGDYGSVVPDDVSDAVEADSGTRAGRNRGVKTNDQWKRRAFGALLAQGINPVGSQRALDLYLAGKPVNRKQKRIVKAALATNGLPPQGNSALTVKRPAAHKPAVKHQEHRAPTPHTSNPGAQVVHHARPKPHIEVKDNGKRRNHR